MSSEPRARIGRASSNGPDQPIAKPRSCVTCRSRKVRCDKKVPCSNCQRGNIACVLPADDKPPRWARRLERLSNTAAPAQDADPGVSQVMDRIKGLEGLVRQLSAELQHARASTSASEGPSSPSPRQESTSNAHGSLGERRDASASTPGSSSQFGRFVSSDNSRGRYVSSGFWSKISDELDGLKMDAEGLAGNEYDSSDEEMSQGYTPSTQELYRSPTDCHSFLFAGTLGSASTNLLEFHPLPSQIPFLITTFAENVNILAQVVHIPTVSKMIRELPGSNLKALTPPNEALMFAIYYAAITSMEEDDVMTNFGVTKSDLNFKYRIGLERALAKADFLNVPDLVLVQAFTIFLFLARRHDSPRFVWMMTGLAIRMALSLGLHRDGSHFIHLSPYQIEMRRRVWWSVCMLDTRSSADQGTDLTISDGSFDTRMPTNLNDTDIDTSNTSGFTEREGLTDTTFTLVSCAMCEIERRMMSLQKTSAPSLEEQSALLNQVFERVDRTYLQYANPTGNITYWMCVTVCRLLIAKLTLLIYLPALFSSPSDHFSDKVRHKLLVAAIEVAEYNHALNSEEKARQWRWLFQTYTHWHSIVYLLLSAARNSWSPLLERAWVALRSLWLIPAQFKADKSLHIWVPLGKLMMKARRHRESELGRLRQDPRAAKTLEELDASMPQPASPGSIPNADSVIAFRMRWKELLSTTHTSNKPGDMGAARYDAEQQESLVTRDGASMTAQAISSSNSFTPDAHHPINAQFGDMESVGFEPWVWAGGESSDMPAEMTGEADIEVDWNSWLQAASALNMPKGE